MIPPLAMLLAAASVPEYFFGDFVTTIAYMFIAIIGLALAYKILDKMTPGVSFDEALKNGNYAVALLIAVYILVVGGVVCVVIRSVLG